MDYAALAGTNHFLHRKEKNLRLILVSIGASILELILLLLLKNYHWYMLMSHFFIGPAMVIGCFGRSSWKRFLENWCICYLMLLLLGGLCEMLNGVNPQIARKAGSAVLVLLLFTIIVRYLAKRRRHGKEIYTVWLRNKEHTIKIQGYWDSGNQLTDCYTKEPVQIVSEKCVRELFLEEPMNTRLIPYHVIGAKNGLMQVLRIEEMRIEQEKGSGSIRPVVIGIAKNGEFDHQDYDMILHATALENVKKTG